MHLSIFLSLSTNKKYIYRTDTSAELELVREESIKAGADAAVVSNHWAEGGLGAVALAKAVIEACEQPSNFKFLYDLDSLIEDKITTIAREIYRAENVELSELAQKQIETYTRQGYGHLPSQSFYFIYPMPLCDWLPFSLHGQNSI